MENNFEDNIKKALNQPPEFPVDATAWSSISQRLEAPVVPVQSNRDRWIWLPIALCMLGLASVAGYYFAQYQNTVEKLNEIENVKSMTTVHYDTIYQKHVTIVYDTIYNNIISNSSKRNKSKGNLYSDFRNNLNSDYFSNKNFTQLQINAFDTPSYFSSASIQSRWEGYHLQPSQISSEKSISNYSISKLIPSAFDYVYSLSDNDIDELNELDFSEIKYKKKKRFLFRTMKPDRLNVGFYAGINNNQVFDLPTVEQENYSVGLMTELGFGNRLSWVIGLDYHYQDRKLIYDENNPFDLSPFPDVPPQNPSDELIQIKNDITAINIPIGFKYSFLPTKKIQPYFGLGFLTRKIVGTGGKFLFMGNQNGITYDYELVRKNFLLTEFNWRNLYGSIGAQARLSNNWKWFIEGKYQYSLPQNNISKLEQLKLWSGNAGLKYQF